MEKISVDLGERDVSLDLVKLCHIVAGDADEMVRYMVSWRSLWDAFRERVANSRHEGIQATRQEALMAFMLAVTDWVMASGIGALIANQYKPPPDRPQAKV